MLAGPERIHGRELRPGHQAVSAGQRDAPSYFIASIRPTWQFADALVSSAIVCFRNTPPPADHCVVFTFGGRLTAPHLTKKVPVKALRAEPKWTRFPVADIRTRAGVPTISDFFKIKRGLATGDNSYFILTAEEIKERPASDKLLQARPSQPTSPND